MRILLINTNRSRSLLPPPPVGLAAVATATARAGHAVRFLDLMMAADPRAELDAALSCWQPEVVGVSWRNVDNVTRQHLVSHVEEVAALVARIRVTSNAVVVLGGSAVGVLGGAVLRHTDAHFAVVGEGEIAFPHLLNELQAEHRWEQVPNLAYRAGDGVVVGSPGLVPHLGASGLERWIGWRAYSRSGATWPIQTRRGCPLMCQYCSYPVLEGCALRRRPAEEVVDEIRHVQRVVGPQVFDIVDSVFNVPPDGAMELCEAILARGLKARLTTSTVNPMGMSRELLSLMQRAGFRSFMISAEAASDASLEGLGKGFSSTEVHRAAELARGCGMVSAWFFLLGGPGETRATADQTVTFVEKKLAWPGNLAVLTTGIRILPGTALARRAIQEGLVSASDDLVYPAFYLSPQVEEDYVLGRVNRAIGERSAIVHTAEQDTSAYSRTVEHILSLLKVAPPYWRFLPQMLAAPGLRFVRSRYPSVGSQS